ncbi:hypothetical protein [Streptomyces alkaliterrae]|uniref:Uncharacterized protein n=1 Tax=Streptomyces alkaliterrae TaxID=2213162 RepID=A0A5P0YJH4_9ACTN|nr:hypothetical protein [Streptomyces alkaliterrae]MBB1252425.1 hypothetical protein [Streptomyces alkaliterrae]MBB1260902.1 hypothetical protein [Streptomyces alkaliterrae]MQS00465.1 hypothetical protein [Streptomyces alkaliterrae]
MPSFGVVHRVNQRAWHRTMALSALRDKSRMDVSVPGMRDPDACPQMSNRNPAGMLVEYATEESPPRRRSRDPHR